MTNDKLPWIPYKYILKTTDFFLSGKCPKNSSYKLKINTMEITVGGPPELTERMFMGSFEDWSLNVFSQGVDYVNLCFKL